MFQGLEKPLDKELTDLYPLISEDLGSYSPTQYPAASMAPRKDFTPFNKKDGYNYSRQSHVDYLPSSPTPNSPVSWPWELATVSDDLADAYVYMEVAAKKLANCAKGNLAITKKQREALLELYKAIKASQKVVEKVGYAVGDVANIAGQPTPDAMVPTVDKAIRYM